MIEERKARFAERTGGYVRNTERQKGRILVANAQKRVPVDGVRAAVARLAGTLRVAIDVESVDAVDVRATPGFLKEKSANSVVYIVDGGESPLLVSPDERWASVSVSALGEGDVAGRLRKETMRALSFLCGGNASGYPNPMTYPVTDVRQLDLIDNSDLPIDVIQRMPQYLERLGVTPYKQATYRTACKQGWAPAPTNDVQKAIWEKVHAIPDKPMTIEFDPKKDK